MQYTNTNNNNKSSEHGRLMRCCECSVNELLCSSAVKKLIFFFFFRAVFLKEISGMFVEFGVFTLPSVWPLQSILSLWKKKKRNSNALFIFVCCANNAHFSTLASWPRLIRLGDSLSHYLNALCFSVTPSSAGHRQQPFQPGFDHPRVSASLPHTHTHRGTH